MAQTPGKVVWNEERDGYSTLPVRLLETPRWRDIGEERWVALYVPGEDAWKRIKAHWTPVLEGLIAGESLAACQERVQEARPDFNRYTCRYVVRKVVKGLERWGMAEIVLPEIPEVLAGRYQRVRELGRGGMGIVWLCRDLERDGVPDVAVKHAWNWKARFAKAEANLRAEAEILGQIDRPRFVRLLDTFELEGRFHMVRAFLPGRTLSEHCGTTELTEARRLRYTRQVAETVDVLREHGFFFFDISSSNYYVDPDLSSVTLGDIGLCRPFDARGIEVKGPIGTRRYSPPEFLGGGTATEASQVYALGRLHYQMVTGNLPVARSSPDRVDRQNRALVEMLKDSRASEREVAFFEVACRTDPDQRPSTLAKAVAVLTGEGG